MRLTVLILCLCLAGISRTVAETPVPELRIDDVPFAPRGVQSTGCGLSVGVDARWRTEKVAKTDSRGRKWQGLKATYGADEAKAHFNHPIIAATATPLVTFTGECARHTWPETAARDRTERVAKWARSQGYRDIRTRKQRHAGRTWHIVEYQTNKKGTLWTSQQTLMSLQNDVLLRVSFFGTTSACRGFNGLLSANHTHEVEVDGKTLRARFGDAKTINNGIVCAQRRHGENLKLFTTIRRTMR